MVACGRVGGPGETVNLIRGRLEAVVTLADIYDVSLRQQASGFGAKVDVGAVVCREVHGLLGNASSPGKHLLTILNEFALWGQYHAVGQEPIAVGVLAGYLDDSSV